MVFFYIEFYRKQFLIAKYINHLKCLCKNHIIYYYFIPFILSV